MKLKVFVIFDSKANVFQGPYLSRSVAEFIRNMSYVAAMDTSSVFHKFGADYTVFESHEWDDSTGEFLCLASRISHGTLLELGAAYLAADEARQRAQVISGGSDIKSV